VHHHVRNTYLFLFPTEHFPSVLVIHFAENFDKFRYYFSLGIY